MLFRSATSRNIFAIATSGLVATLATAGVLFALEYGTAQQVALEDMRQIAGTQAVMNVTQKERYAVIPDELIRYALGRFGRPNVPLDQNVMDRIMSLPRTRELQAEPDMAPLPELRRRIGATLSDEEFLLRATMPEGQVDAMKAAGPAKRRYNPEVAPVMNLLRQVAARTDLSGVSIEKEGFRLELS